LSFWERRKDPRRRPRRRTPPRPPPPLQVKALLPLPLLERLPQRQKALLLLLERLPPRLAEMTSLLVVTRRKETALVVAVKVVVVVKAVAVAVVRVVVAGKAALVASLPRTPAALLRDPLSTKLRANALTPPRTVRDANVIKRKSVEITVLLTVKAV